MYEGRRNFLKGMAFLGATGLLTGRKATAQHAPSLEQMSKNLAQGNVTPEMAKQMSEDMSEIAKMLRQTSEMMSDDMMKRMMERTSEM